MTMTMTITSAEKQHVLLILSHQQPQDSRKNTKRHEQYVMLHSVKRPV